MIIIIHTIISIFVINYSYIYIVMKFSFILKLLEKRNIYIKNRKNYFKLLFLKI